MRGSGSMSSVLRKGAWTAEEDMLLKNYIQKFGEGKWHLVPLKAGLNRCRKSCRLRWLNYLKPDIKRGHFQEDEVDLMHRLHKLLGNRWSLIAGRLPGRTANDVKNYWNTHVVGRSKKEKTQLKEDEFASQEGMVQVIKPQACTISKTFVMHPQNETQKSGNVITSSNSGYQNSFNSSLELVSSPTISDGLIKQYFNELFPDQDNEINELGCSLRSFPRDGEDLHVFGNENIQNSLFTFPIEEDMWEFLEPEQM